MPDSKSILQIAREIGRLKEQTPTEPIKPIVPSPTEVQEECLSIADLTFSIELIGLTDESRAQHSQKLLDYLHGYNICKVLSELGFRNDGGFIRFIKGQIVYDVGDDVQTIKHTVEDILKNRSSEETNDFFKKLNSLINRSSLESLPKLKSHLIQDTVSCIRLPYLNGVLEIDRSGTILHPYSTFSDSLVPAARIIKRRFDVSPDKFTIAYIESAEWHKFLKNVCTDPRFRETGEHFDQYFDGEQFRCLLLSIGRMIHHHFNPSDPSVLVFTDRKSPGEEKKKLGRTGKGVICEGIRNIRPYSHAIDSRQLDKNEKFRFEQVKPGMQFIQFDDPANLSELIDSMFSMLTIGMTINSKNVKHFTIPKKEMPKFCITSNFAETSTEDSVRDRRYDIPLYRWYTADYKPKDEFKHNLFEQWNEEEWSKFDHYMAYCCWQYFLARCNMHRVPDFSNSVREDDLKQKIGSNMLEFLEAKIGNHVRLGNEVTVPRKAYKEQYNTSYGEEITTTESNKRIKMYAELNDCQCIEGKISDEQKTIIDVYYIKPKK